MSKNKKIILSVVSIVLISTVIFIKPILSFSISTFLKFEAKRVISASLNYKSLDIEKNKIILKEACFTTKNNNKINTEKILINIDFNLFKAKFKTSIFIEDLKAFLYKDQFKSLLDVKKSGNKLIDLSLNISNGKVFLIDSKTTSCIFFDLVKKNEHNDNVCLFFGDNKDQKIDVMINKIDKDINISSDITKIDLKNLNSILSFFDVDYIQNIKGNIKGLFNFSIRNNNIGSVVSNLDFSEISFYDQKTALQYDMAKCHLEFDYPDVFENDVIFLNFLKNDIFKKSKVRLNFDKMQAVSACHKTKFTDLKGLFSFNPGVGPKLSITGFVDNDIKHDIAIDMRGYFASSVADWLDFQCLIDEKKSRICLRAKQKDIKSFNVLLDLENIHDDLLEITKDIIKPVSNQLDDIAFNQGILNTSIDFEIKNNNIQSVALTNLNIENLKCKKNNTEVYIGFCEGRSLFDFSKKDPFENAFFSFKIFSSAIIFQDKKITDFNAEIHSEKGIFQSSAITANLDDVFFAFDIKGHIKDFNILSKIKGKLNTFEDEFSSVITLKKKNKNYSLSGNVQFNDLQEAVFGFELDKIFIFNLSAFYNSIKNGWVRAEKINLQKWPQLFNIDLDIYGKADISVFFKNNSISMQLKGENLAYKNPFVELKIDQIGNLNNFSFEKNKYVQINYKNGLFDLKTPDFKGNLLITKFNVNLAVESGNIKIDKNKLYAQIKDSSADSVAIQADICFDMNDLDNMLLDINITDFKSDIVSFQNLVRHFEYDKNIDAQGTIEGSFLLTSRFSEETYFDWSINGSIKNGFYVLNNNSQIDDLNLDFNYSSQNAFEASNILATLDLIYKKYQIVCPVVQNTKDGIYFDFRLQNEIIDVLRIAANVKNQNDLFKISINDDLSHFYFDKLNIQDFILNNKLEIENIFVANTTSADRFFAKIQFLFDTGIIPINNFDLLRFSDSKATFQYFLKTDENKDLKFNVLSKNLSITHENVNYLEINGIKKKSKIDIEKVIFDDFESNFSINIDEKAYKVSNLDIKKKDSLLLKLQGLFFQDEAKFTADILEAKIDLKKLRSFLSKYINFPFDTIDGYLKGKGSIVCALPIKNKNFDFVMDLDLNPSNLVIDKIRLYNTGPININLSLFNELVLQGLDLSFYSKDMDLSYLNCQVGKVSYDFNTKYWKLLNSDLHIPKNVFLNYLQSKKYHQFLDTISFDEDMVFSADIKCLSDLSNVSVFLKNFDFSIDSKKHFFKDIVFEYLPDQVDLNFKYLFNEHYYSINNQVELKKDIFIKTSFDDKKSLHPLTILWNLIDENIRIKEMKGSFSGIDACFQEDNDALNITNLFGSLKLDLAEAKKLMPKNILDLSSKNILGKGYSLSGHLKVDPKKDNFLSFKGIFSGKDFELLDFQFKTLFSNIEIDANNIKVTDLKISDTSGILSINEMLFNKKEDDWYLSIPNVKVKELRPSLFKKINQPMEEMTPFLIRELNLNDFKGKLSDKTTFTGKGHLNFINSFKRGYHVFEFPTDVLSRIVGLDLELLTPVKGKIKFEAKDGKFYLTEMKDSYSENERSKFFLSDKGGRPYIDFAGNIYINIAMKQYVLFKFTESFIISIRGDLDEPKCNLKKKRGFLN